MPADGITLYYWSQEAYDSASVLSAENATGAVAMTVDGAGVYQASVTGIAAKDLDKGVYVAAVYESEGVTYASGVLPYSIAAYCKNAHGNVRTLADAAMIYGCAAKAFFHS